MTEQLNRLSYIMTYKFLRGEIFTREAEEMQRLPAGDDHPDGKACVEHLMKIFDDARKGDKFEALSKTFAKGNFTPVQLRDWAENDKTLDLLEYGIGEVKECH